MYRLLASLAISALALASDDFNDSLARNNFLPLASAAYGNLQQKCLDKHMPGAKLSFHAEIACDNVTTMDTCSGYTVVDSHRGFIALVFRGTNTDEQLDLEIYTTLNDEKVPFRDGGEVVPYFRQAFDLIWDDAGLGDDFKKLASIYPDYKLYITGHSLGGALAALGAVHVAKNNLFNTEKIVYYTFGEPRTGDKTFANLLDSLIPQKHFRVVHDHDMIPHCPFLSMHYQHHATEVWYANDMSPGSPYKVCVGQEDSTCSSSNQFNLNFDPDHPHYYGIHVPTYGRSGCTDNSG
ncbi:hypothetical protein PRIPAC_72006 [Pristionchus pacificus]|nr:hypothetical protein PRIPAC_72006 [Pristionchus pacificus]